MPLGATSTTLMSLRKSTPSFCRHSGRSRAVVSRMFSATGRRQRCVFTVLPWRTSHARLLPVLPTTPLPAAPLHPCLHAHVAQLPPPASRPAGSRGTGPGWSRASWQPGCGGTAWPGGRGGGAKMGTYVRSCATQQHGPSRLGCTTALCLGCANPSKVCTAQYASAHT